MINICNQNKFWKTDLIKGGLYQACSKQQLVDKIKACSHVVKEINHDPVIDIQAMELGIGPNVIIFKCGGHVYLVQERLEMTLTEYLKSHRFSDRLKKKLSNMITDTIFKMGIFHNDLHSDNIMMRKGGVPVLIDYETAIKIDTIGKKKFEAMLKRNSYIRIIEKIGKIYQEKQINIISKDNITEIQTKLCPIQQKTKKEIQDQQKIKDASKKARQQLLKRMQKFMKKKDLKY
jgi:predicted unusual protein kinase regulating ubiquinone biosynthesis (AarF/ABC1/UbiB family)